MGVRLLICMLVYLHVFVANTQSITTFHLFILLLILTLAGSFGGVQMLPLGSRGAHSGFPDSLITAGRRFNSACDASAWPRNMRSSMASNLSESYSGSGSRRPTSTPRSCKLHFGTSPAMCIAIPFKSKLKCAFLVDAL